MKIVLILRTAEGGIRAHVEALLRGYLQRGHDAWLITHLPKADATFLRQIESAPHLKARIISVPMKSAPGPWDIIALWRIRHEILKLEKHGPVDVVHGHGAKGGLFARLLRVFKFVPKSTRILYTPHGGSLHAMHGRVLNTLYGVIERWLAKNTDLVLLESRYSMERFKMKVGENAAPMRLNRNGIPNIKSEVEKWPADLGKTSVLKIGAFGLLRSIKGFDVLIRAIAQVKARGWNLRLDIWGEGAERTALHELSHHLGLQNEVTIHRETPKSLEMMRSCHIVAQPSLFESFGLVALEAQALGCAVVASRVGGLTEVVLHEKTGLLVSPSDVSGLTDAILWFLENPEKTLVLRTSAAQRAQLEFSEEKMIDGALSAYQNWIDPVKESR